jgi:hypothetical protein
MKKFMEKPEVKSKMDEFRTAQEQQRQREYAMVYKVLDRRQVSTFKKMLGKPFDLESVMGGMFRVPGQRNGPRAGAAATPKTDTAKTTAPKTDTAKAPDAAATSSSKSSSTTTSRRQSLRERRGLGQQQTPSSSPN